MAVVARSRRRDALIPGKTNLDEFVMGLDPSLIYGATVKNPVDETRSPGGSSGGSAVAVAGRHGACFAWPDTGGSIRQPASFTGCVGPQAHVRVGPLVGPSSPRPRRLIRSGTSRATVRRGASVLQVIAGHDERCHSLALPMLDLEAACGASG